MNHDPAALAAGVLVGGQSRRMGLPKPACILVSGAPMLEHVVVATAMFAESVFLLGCSRVPVPLPVVARCLPDQRQCAGPLAGIETLLATGAARRFLVAACDQPLLDGSVLAPLLSEANDEDRIRVLSNDGHVFEPFPSVWPASCAAALTHYLDAGGRRVQDFLRASPLRLVRVPNGAFDRVRNFNTPEELASWNLLPVEAGQNTGAQTPTRHPAEA